MLNCCIIFKELIKEIFEGINKNVIIVDKLLFSFFICFNLIIFVYKLMNNNIMLIIEVGIGIGEMNVKLLVINIIMVKIVVCCKNEYIFFFIFFCFFLFVFYGLSI